MVCLILQNLHPQNLQSSSLICFIFLTRNSLINQYRALMILWWIKIPASALWFYYKCVL